MGFEGGREEHARPKDIEKLPQSERVGRLFHELGVIYGRVFLTGDWDEPAPVDDNRIRNVFDEVASVQDADTLANDLQEFILHASPNVAIHFAPEDMLHDSARNEFNRRVFLDILQMVVSIFEETKRLPKNRDDIAMMKCIDENMRYFRDMPPQLHGTWGVPSQKEQTSQAAAGLLAIRARLKQLTEA